MIIDVLNDDGSLETVEQIFSTYEQYQTQMTQMMNNLQAQEQQTLINEINNQDKALQQQMEQGVQNMNNEAAVDNALTELGL